MTVLQSRGRRHERWRARHAFTAASLGKLQKKLEAPILSWCTAIDMQMQCGHRSLWCSAQSITLPFMLHTEIIVHERLHHFFH